MKKLLSGLLAIILSTCTAIPAQAWVFAPPSGASLDTITGANSFLGQYLSRGSAGVWTAHQGAQSLGVCDFLSTVPAILTDSASSATNTSIDIAAWLDECYKEGIDYGSRNKADLIHPACIYAIAPGITEFGLNVNSPEYLPPGVCFNPLFVSIRVGNSGTPLNNWNGDPSTKQLSNLEQPAWILPPTTEVENMRVVANSVGTDRGSGVFYGKTWRMAQLTPQAGGTGFAGGETCSVANGDIKAPAASATFTCSHATAGACDTITFAPTRWATQTGQYYHPPAAQRRIWAVSTNCDATHSKTGLNDCWDGHDVLHPQVFDNDTNHYYKTSCSGGAAGLTVSALFWPDWCTGVAGDSDTVSCAATTGGIFASNPYDGAFSNFSASSGHIGQLYVEQSGDVSDVNYGFTYGFWADGLELTTDYIQTQKAHFGTVLEGSDIVIGHINDVGSHTQFYWRGGSIHVRTGRFDTPTDLLGTNDAHAFSLQYCQNCDLFFDAFHNGNSAADVGSPYGRIGDDTSISDSTHRSTGTNLKGQMYSDGTGGINLTALGIANLAGTNTIDVTVTNSDRNEAASAQQFTKFADFTGGNIDTGLRLLGTIDRTSGSIWTGTAPNAAISVWDAAINAWDNGRSTTQWSNNGVITFATANTSAGVNFITVNSANTGLAPGFTASGTDTDVSFGITAKGAGSINLNPSGGRAVKIVNIASAVNALSLSGAATGGSPTITTVGGDSNPNLFISAAGTGNIVLGAMTTRTGDARVTADVSSVSTTLADITGLVSPTLVAGKTYTFRAALPVTLDVTGGQKYAIGGTATATAITYQINSLCNATNLFVINSHQTAIGGSAGQAGCTDGFTTIEGTITVNAGGTITAQFAENAASGTSKVLRGATFVVQQIQ